MCVCVCVYVCVCMCVCVCVRACVRACVFCSVHLFICLFVCLFVCVWVAYWDDVNQFFKWIIIKQESIDLFMLTLWFHINGNPIETLLPLSVSAPTRHTNGLISSQFSWHMKISGRFFSSKHKYQHSHSIWYFAVSKMIVALGNLTNLAFCFKALPHTLECNYTAVHYGNFPPTLLRYSQSFSFNRNVW